MLSGGALQGDAKLVIQGYLLLTLYATLVMWMEFGRAALGPICVGVVLLSVGASFGIVIGAGQEFSLVVNSVIFVLLGLGVDEAFVIMSALSRQPPSLDPAQRMSRALAEAGGSITLTSLTDFVAFSIGSTTVIPALRSFCIFAGVAVLFDYVFQVTLFVAAVVMLGDRNCCCSASKTAARAGRGTVAVGADAARGDDANIAQAVGSLPAAPETSAMVARSPSRMQRLVGEQLPRAILSRRGKAAVLVTTAAFLGVCAVGAAQLKMEFHYDWFIPKDTELKGTMAIRDAHFGGMYLPVDMVTKEADYFTNIASYKQMVDEFRANPDILAGSTDAWYDMYLQRDLASGEAQMPATSTAFYASVHAFVHSSAGERQSRNVKFSADNSTIVATRVPALFIAHPGIAEQLVAMRGTRAVCDRFPVFSGTTYSYPMLFWEGLAVVEEEIMRNVALAAACVFFVCWVVMNNLLSAVIVLCIIAMVDVCLLGSMFYVGDTINMVSAINVLLAIGLSIDYSAHVVHAFFVARGTRNERAAAALEHIGLPVLNGGLSTFVGTLAMLQARSYVFQMFGRMFFLIVFLGLYFGIIVLPVVLSIGGPLPKSVVVVPGGEQDKSAQLAKSGSEPEAAV